LNQIINFLLKIIILIYALFHFITFFWEAGPLMELLSLSGIFILILSFLYNTLRNFKLPFTLLIISSLILFSSHTHFYVGFSSGMLQMRSVIGLLIVIPLISAVLREEPYIEDIMALFHRFIHTSKRFYFVVVSFTQLIAYFLLFGAIPMMHQFVNIILKNETSLAWENYKGTALLRGFSLSTLWVISIPSFIFVVETLGAPLLITIVQGMSLALLGTILAVVFAHFQEKRFGIQITPVLQKRVAEAVSNASPPETRFKKLIEFILLFITLFGTVFVIHGIFHASLMIVIPIVIVVWLSCFYLIKGRVRKLPIVFSRYFRHDLSSQSYQLSVMLSVGVLIYSLHQTNFSMYVVNGLTITQETFPFINVLSLLPFIIIILGLMGLGPLTVMVLVAGMLESMSFPYPTELIVLSITSGSVISTLISPLIMPVIVLSAANKLSILTNGFTFNWKFALTFYLMIQLYIQFALHFNLFT